MNMTRMKDYAITAVLGLVVVAAIFALVFVYAGYLQTIRWFPAQESDKEIIRLCYQIARKSCTIAVFCGLCLGFCAPRLITLLIKNRKKKAQE